MAENLRVVFFVPDVHPRLLWVTDRRFDDCIILLYLSSVSTCSQEKRGIETNNSLVYLYQPILLWLYDNVNCSETNRPCKRRQYWGKGQHLLSICPRGKDLPLNGLLEELKEKLWLSPRSRRCEYTRQCEHYCERYVDSFLLSVSSFYSISTLSFVCLSRDASVFSCVSVEEA